jgi:hypothetical protein
VEGPEQPRGTTTSLVVTAADPVGSARRAAEAIQRGGVLYYALGGGLGHLTRGLAIARRFEQVSSLPFAVLTNCRAAIRSATPVLRLEDAANPEADALSGLLQALVEALQPTVLAVDAFPAGILGELPAMLLRCACRKVAILRRLQGRWAQRWNLPRVLGECYDATALVEPGSRITAHPAQLRTIETAPVLICDAGELLPPAEARRRLAGPLRPGEDVDAPLVCAVATGTKPFDLGLLQAARRAVRAVSARAALRFVTPFPGSTEPRETVSHFPLMELFAGIELVIGAAGYNLYHETGATRTPAILVPQSRRYDDQFARAATDPSRPVAHSLAELMSYVRAVLVDVPREREIPAYANGAEQVARLIAELAG